MAKSELFSQRIIEFLEIMDTICPKVAMDFA